MELPSAEDTAKKLIKDNPGLFKDCRESVILISLAIIEFNETYKMVSDENKRIILEQLNSLNNL